MKSLLRIILPLAAALTATISSAALPTGHFSTKSKLSSGKWVKLRLSNTGMHAISFEQLRQWGFSDPAKVAVYGYGNAELIRRTSFAEDIPDDLRQTATLCKDDRIIFYGEATTRLTPASHSTMEFTHNIYDNYGYYFLSDCEERVPLTYKEYNPDNSGNSMRNVHLSAQIVQPDDHNHMNGGAYWLGPELSQESTLEYTFPVKGFGNDYGSVDYGTMGYTFVAADESDTTSVNVVQPANVVVPYVANRYPSRTGSENTFFNIATGTARFQPRAEGDLENSSVTYGFKLHNKKNAPRFAAIKNVWTIYPRRNDMCGDSQMAMTFTSAFTNQNFIITCPREIEVWNVGSPTDVYAYRTIYDASEGTVTGSFDKQYSTGASAARLIAFDPMAEMYTPEFDGEVPNQNIHGDETPDMVIISTSELYDAACELADIHRSFGSKVNVYTHQQVLNEFGSGGAAPMAYKMMVKMFYERDPKRFRHLLLYGPATWDFRGLIMPANEYLLTFLADRESHYKGRSANFSSDAYFGMVDDRFSSSQIEMADNLVAVGRLNVPNSGTGHDVNMKIREYMQNPLDPAIYARILIMTCNGDANAHFYQGQDVADNTLAINPAFTATRAHISLYPIANGKAEFTTRKVMSALYEGQGLLDYSGHGDENNLGRGNAIVWQKANSAGMTNSKYPIAMLSTCSAYSPDRGNNDIGTSFTFKQGAGAIASIGACRKVYLAYNSILNSAIACSYAEATPGSTIGDMYVRARQLSIAGCNNNKDALANNMCYNLCGDPLVKLPVPDYKARITSIGGKQPTADTPVAVAPGNRINLSGIITDNAGQTISSFNGSIRAIVYDGPINIRQQITEGTDTVRTIALEEEILAEIGGRVKDGQFSLDICLPQPRVPGKRNRIILSALTDGNSKYGALGYTNDFVIDLDATPTDPQQGKAPVISSMYINEPGFRNGCELAADDNLTFFAVVEAPGTGISNSSAIIGATPRLTLDGRRDFAGIGSGYTIDEQGRYVFSLPLGSEFSAGYHDLKFSLSNTLGESASRSISFLITPATYKVDVTIAEPTATDFATIEAECSVAADTNRLLIADLLGNTVFSASDISFPYRWNLKDNSGKDVADGAYSATVLMADDKGNGASQPATIVVVRN